jgi:hypothetical protein
VPPVKSGAIVLAKQPAGAPGPHEHDRGPHGGTVVEIGGDYYAEVVFEKDGVVRVFMLGKDETKPQEVEVQKLTAFARAPGEAAATEFELKSEPRKGDAKGKTSRFVGALPKGLRSKQVEVTVPSIRIGGERFRFAFSRPPGKAAESGKD